MRIWLPYVKTGTGTDVFTNTLADSLRDRGHGAHVAPFSHAWQYAPSRLRLVKEPDHTQIVIANSWNAFAFKRRGIPLVSVEHLLVLDPALAPYKSFPQAVFHNTLVRRFERLSANRADATVAVSRYTAEQLKEHLAIPAASVIYNGVDTRFFRPGSNITRISVDRPMRLLFVGTLSQRKGADLLQPIMDRLGPDFELRFTGDFQSSQFLRPRSGLVSLGRLDRDAIRAEYQAADLLLFPSRLEGLPLVALEAMACGTPVVASRSGSLIETVDDGVNGLLCPVDDVDAFAGAILQLRANADRLLAMGQAARKSAEAAFSIDRMTDNYLALFDQLAGEPENRAG